MSGKRLQLLVTGEIYHVFNRSILYEEIFRSPKLLERSLNLLEYYRFPQTLRYSHLKRLPSELKEDYIKKMENSEPLVEIYASAFMTNHYHLLIKQLIEEGIRKFIANLQNSFAKYYNLLNNRHGPVFQGPFRAKRISTDNELLHVSRYVHLNPVTSFLIDIKQLKDYPWTSYPQYLSSESGRKSGNVKINTDLILSLVGSRYKYEKFVVDQSDYQRKLHLVKHLVLE